MRGSLLIFISEFLWTCLLVYQKHYCPLVTNFFNCLGSWNGIFPLCSRNYRLPPISTMSLIMFWISFPRFLIFMQQALVYFEKTKYFPTKYLSKLSIETMFMLTGFLQSTSELFANSKSLGSYFFHHVPSKTKQKRHLHRNPASKGVAILPSWATPLQHKKDSCPASYSTLLQIFEGPWQIID